jgi:D-alanine--poly(phosphoribitol) ligase subunit 2
MVNQGSPEWRERLIELVGEAAAEVNSSAASQIEELGTDFILFGDGGSLDSLGLVRLVVAVENAIEDDYGKVLTLADDRAMSQKNSPFRSVGTMADYITMLLHEQSDD